MRGDAVCFQLQQNEVRFGGICLDIFPCGKLCEGFSSFLGNEGLCFLMEGKIRKDMLTDKIRKAVYAPRVCVRFEAIQKCLIGGNAIAQTDAGGGKELGGAADDEQVIKGEQKFYEAKCHLCHVTTLHTKPRGSSLLMGTQLPWLGSQTIHPYSDFLLHDMGSEIMGVGLNDNYVSGLARGNEWRTTPLWGIGLQEIVNGHTYFLHDGRARNLVEAIMWHGGEAEASKNLFKNMSKEDRDALVAFINSL